jgi:cytochrome c oxidase subunit 3
MTPGPQSPRSASEELETEWFGAVLALGAWTMFFAALVFTTGYLRLREPWPIAGALVPPLFPLSLGLLSLTGGSVLMHTAHGRLCQVPTARSTPLWSLAGTLALGVGFLGLHAAVASSLWKAGLRLPSGGAHASSFYGLQAAHVLHAAVGLVGLARLGVHLARGAEVLRGLRLWTLYWHFVTVTGLLFFAAVSLP